jgi:hypothetical protein
LDPGVRLLGSLHPSEHGRLLGRLRVSALLFVGVRLHHGQQVMHTPSVVPPIS